MDNRYINSYLNIYNKTGKKCTDSDMSNPIAARKMHKDGGIILTYRDLELCNTENLLQC